MCDSMSGSTEFKKRNLSQCIRNPFICVKKHWKGRVSFHMKVDQFGEHERVIEGWEVEVNGGHTGVKMWWVASDNL